MRTSADFHYVISDERLLAYARVPLIDRLRWLDDLVCFTQQWRAAPKCEHVDPASGGRLSELRESSG